MKVLSIGLIGLLAAAAPFAAIAGKDASQIWQQERLAPDWTELQREGRSGREFYSFQVSE